MRKKLMTLAAVLCCFLSTTVFTACIDNIDNAAPVVVTDDKPFAYGQYVDGTVRPGDDFFRYQYGLWLADGTQPSLARIASQKLKQVEEQVLTTSDDPAVATLRRLVAAAEIDCSADEALLRTRLEMLASITTQEQLLEAFAQMHKWGYSPLVRQIVFGDQRVLRPVLTSEIPSVYVIDAFNAKNEVALSRMLKTLCNNLERLGFSEERTTEIYENALEVELVEMSFYESHFNMIERIKKPRVRKAPRAAVISITQQVCDLMGIGELAPQLLFFDTREQQILEMLGGLLLEGSEQSVAQMRDYLIAYLLGQEILYIPTLTADISSTFRMSFAMRHATYHMYRLQVEAYGRQNIYADKCLEMMNNFRDILIERIGNLDWMSDATKKAAQKKAAMMKFYIGYPDEWNDDLTPVVEGNTLLEGMASLRLHQKAFMRELTGKSTDTHGWDFWCSLTPFTTYNAMYDTSNNQLIILPVFLTSPLFDLTQSEATLYGTAAVFGHEMCHGFDAGGSKNDEIGAERDWWTAEDKAAFEQKQQQLIDLWGQLEHYPGQPANGQFTLGENMADYGGVTLALEAYTRRLREQGFNGAQFDEQIKKFWLAYGMPISVEERELNVELLKKSYLDDVHSAGHNRVNGIARLFDDWYRLYDVKPTDKLYLAPEDRVKIW